MKPSVSFASYGISIDSVINSDEQISAQVQRLLQGHQVLRIPSDGFFVEEFINGAEFTVFVLGSYQSPHLLKTYPPVERAFQENVSDSERFVAEEYWEKEPNYGYQLVASPLSDKLCKLSQQAYCSVNGNG